MRSTPHVSPLRPRARRLAAPTLALALVVGIGTGCASVFSPAPRESPLAYRIEAPSGASGWLYGSIHHGRPAQQSLPPRLQQALDAAALWVLEIDLTRHTPNDLAAAMIELGSLEAGLRLRDVISRDTWAAVQAHAKKTGIRLADLDRLEPWVVFLFFSSRSLEQAGLDTDHGVENQVMAARPATKPVRGLETPQEQFSAFDDLPPSLQERLLLESMEVTQAGPDDTTGGDLLEAWRYGDAARLEAILFDGIDDPEMKPFFENTYLRRNRHMARGLEAILAEQSDIFAIVGVGHLVGEESIPRLLDQAGLRVERVWLD